MVHVKDIPRYEALGEYARRYPDLEPASYEAFLVLMYTGERIKALVEQRLLREGTSHARFIVLAKLNRDEPHRMPASELASRIGVTKQTMSSLLDGLEKDGFVKRLEDPSDRRVTLVALTDSGQAFVNRVLPGLFRSQADMMQALDRQELVQLSSMLRRLWVSFDAALGAEPAPGTPNEGDAGTYANPTTENS